jgi:hypothetical protein
VSAKILDIWGTGGAAIILTREDSLEESLQRLSDAYEHLFRQETRATEAKRPSTRTPLERFHGIAYSYGDVTFDHWHEVRKGVCETMPRFSGREQYDYQILVSVVLCLFIKKVSKS